MLEIVEKGVLLPDDVTSFEIIAKIMVTKNGKKEYFNKKEDMVFNHRILLTDEVETKKHVEKIIGKKSENVKAFTREDFNNFSKLIKIKEKEEELTI